MEVCNKEQSQEYRDQFGQLAGGREASHSATLSPAAYKTLSELGLDSVGGDEHVFGCGD